MISIGPVVSEKKMFENVDGRMDDGVTGILYAHQWVFGSGELKSQQQQNHRLRTDSSLRHRGP